MEGRRVTLNTALTVRGEVNTEYRDIGTGNICNSRIGLEATATRVPHCPPGNICVRFKQLSLIDWRCWPEAAERF